MAYHKRDYLYPKSNTFEATVLIKNQAPLLISIDPDPRFLSPVYISTELMDGVCDTFYAMLDLAESQGLPVLQLCRLPNFLDFLEINIKSKKNENYLFPIK